MKAAIRDASPPPEFRHWLGDQLAARCERNPQYSLRAFANYLAIDHSTLSQLLRGKRTITRETIEKIGFRLGLSQQETERWMDIESARPKSAPSPQPITQLACDMAEVLQDWRNFAILELTRLDHFQPDSRWIARMLDITVDEVNICISRLCRLRLLEMTNQGAWNDLLGDVVMDIEHFSEAAIANFIGQARSATSGVQTAATIAVPSQRIPAALERIAQFRQDLLQWLAASESKDEVYQLEIRFVPLTRPPQ